MNNLERIRDIFTKTNDIMKLWTDFGAEHTENPQVSHILYYLSLTAGYLKSEEEAKVFQEKWNEIKDNIKSGSDKQDWLNQSHMINSHLGQALKEESVHSPSDSRNIGIARFYEEAFPKLYSSAKNEYGIFQKQQELMVERMRKHHEEVFSSQESWEDALRRGDWAALCD
jgi:hypothetical protein